jgi:transposase
METTRNAEVVLAEAAPKRPYRSKQERRAVVEETLRSGASVAVIARRHGVNANQVFQWRKLFREGRLDVAAPTAQLVPVRMAEEVSEKRPAAKLGTGVIVVEVGRARIRVEGSVDAETLRLILERVGR